MNVDAGKSESKARAPVWASFLPHDMVGSITRQGGASYNGLSSSYEAPHATIGPTLKTSPPKGRTS